MLCGITFTEYCDVEASCVGLPYTSSAPPPCLLFSLSRNVCERGSFSPRRYMTDREGPELIKTNGYIGFVFKLVSYKGSDCISRISFSH